jgi:hypothetical protein
MTICQHYRTQELCGVLEALDKGYSAFGKAFAECYTRHNSHGKILVGKEDFVECFISGTRQSLCQVLKKHSVKNEHSAKNESKNPEKIAKNVFFTREAPTGLCPPEIASRGIFRALRGRRDSNPQPLPRA